MPVPFIVTPDRAPRPLNVVGEKITVLASGAQTGGYEIFLQVGSEGSGPPPHSHPWDESFYVLAEGEVMEKSIMNRVWCGALVAEASGMSDIGA